MALFKDIVKECGILSEMRAENDNRIIDAINKVVRVRMTYNDKKNDRVWTYDHKELVGPEKGKNERYILPVAYGLTKSGKKAIRAYETAGSTRRGAPHWKLFLVDNIVSWSNGKKSFIEYKDQLINMGLNTQGDKGLTTLYAITPIANGNIQVAKDSSNIKQTPIDKNTVQPTTQSQNPQTTDKNNFTSAQSQRQTSIDNSQSVNYLKDKIEAPETSPVTKQQVSPEQNFRHNLRGINGQFVKSPYNFASEKPQFDINSDEWNREYEKASQSIKDSPITKDELTNTEDNQLATSFKDMTDRMDNLNKDEDEEEKKD